MDNLHNKSSILSTCPEMLFLKPFLATCAAIQGWQWAMIYSVICSIEEIDVEAEWTRNRSNMCQETKWVPYFRWLLPAKNCNIPEGNRTTPNGRKEQKPDVKKNNLNDKQIQFMASLVLIVIVVLVILDVLVTLGMTCERSTWPHPPAWLVRRGLTMPQEISECPSMHTALRCPTGHFCLGNFLFLS